MPSTYNVPRIVTAALKGGAGKTLITVGIIAGLRKRGYTVAAFKKGPDYIDAAWLAIAAGGRCHNLDRYLFGTTRVKNSFELNTIGKQVAVVEGNRGLFDGVDAQGTYSTADLARILEAPVILIVDATKMTRTAAALVLGCQKLEPGTPLAGVILNRVAGVRHRKVLTKAIEKDAGLPVIGSIEKLAWPNLPQRHLGLLPIFEHPDSTEFLNQTAKIIENHVDLHALMEIAQRAGPLPSTRLSQDVGHKPLHPGSRVRIGVVQDSAFQFYYPENLDSLKGEGAELVEINALKSAELPDMHALYIGGGFPETHAEILAENTSLKTALKTAIDQGLPVYAECGGLIYLCQSLQIDDRVFPMVNVFPTQAVLQRKPQGLGYITVQVVQENPFYPVGKELTGHEFHYSTLSEGVSLNNVYAFRVLRGTGMGGRRDGLVYRNVLGAYLHIHAAGEPAWAEGILAAAQRFRSQRAVQYHIKPLIPQH